MVEALEVVEVFGKRTGPSDLSQDAYLCQPCSLLVIINQYPATHKLLQCSLRGICAVAADDSKELPRCYELGVCVRQDALC